MASTLVRNRHRTASASSPRTAQTDQAASAGHDAPDVLAEARARDWAEIQERMLVPLYEAVYARLEVGAGSRLLGLGCGSGLALLIAAARGASVTGADDDPGRLALARERLTASGTAPVDARLVSGTEGLHDARRPAWNLVTAFQPIGGGAGDARWLEPALRAAVAGAERGAAVVLTGWGPPERCATSGVLRVAHKGRSGRRSVPESPRDGLEDVAARAGLRPDGSGRVACPFGYADADSAVRGLMSTGLYDAAVRDSDTGQVAKEITEALHPYRRPDGTVWMPNVFRYLIARTP
ncbi:methyltransferase domain-containing protein [Streptomyces sp. t39]|uniref:methyltransferase domain-containing protein n=1 Tax=Streptomyces sp. t39 TaxID=1828156 RepID=UPI0011CD3FBA|nr:methyltransferase domain-containing protein [Streptomyces sp. t39]TXS57119.1 SAM-dependent methyltransferase [Streptomyces sp. t39]